MAKPKPARPSKPSTVKGGGTNKLTRAVGTNVKVKADDAMLDRLAKGGKPNANSNLEKLFGAWKSDVEETP